MLYLKEANMENAEKEWLYITDIPEDENGFGNSYFGIGREEFERSTLPKIIANSQGIGLPEGHVPETYFFLWEDDNIVGLFKIRHYLNEGLRNGAGHIGYGVKKDCLGTRGLALTIEKAKKIIKEDEIYMSVNIDNPASLKVMEKDGAYIHHSDEHKYYTRIKL